MDGKEAIIKEILSSAEKTAAEMIASAEKEKQDALEQTKEDLRRRWDAAVSAAESKAKEKVERSLTLAELDGRKSDLKAKQAMIDKVYEAAAVKILNMTDNVYREYIASFVERYADNGDEIVIALRDAKRLNYDFVDKLSHKLNKTLSLSNDFHDGMGGIILSGTKYDKNLTLKAMIRELKPQTENTVADKLFKNKG